MLTQRSNSIVQAVTKNPGTEVTGTELTDTQLTCCRFRHL
jgi:hypothetical protein